MFLNDGDEEKFAYQAGQFAELSIPGKGEIPIGIASSPVEKGFVKFTVNKAGVVTTHLHNMQVGDIMGIRGPLGNWYPWDLLEGKNVLDHRRRLCLYNLALFDHLHARSGKSIPLQRYHVVYGARTPGMLLYKDELIEWEKRDDINMHITVDGTDDPDWKYNVGFVPPITEQKAPQGDDDTYAIVCGPPIMIKFTQPVLEKLGYTHDHIIMSLENRMKCGIGMCGRCNIGKELVCKDGPVFTLDQINETPREY